VVLETHHREGREVHEDRVGFALPGPVLMCRRAAVVADIAAVVGFGVGVEDFLVEAGL
jgi:hypothetical protein